MDRTDPIGEFHLPPASQAHARSRLKPCVRAWVPRFLATGGIIAAVVVVALRNPASDSLFPPCLLHALSGWQCPGCGTARALHALLGGDLPAALRWNPLAVIAIVPLGYSFVGWVSRVHGRPGLPRVPLPAAGVWGILAVILLFAILRNVPFLNA